MIEVKGVTKRYGEKYAAKDVTFSIDRGEVVGFLGRNGAGKSTTMNIIAGYISSTSGTVEVDGFDILQDPEEVKRRIGYLPEQPPVYMDMTVDEYLRFVCDIKKVKKSQQKGHLDEICELVRITDVRKRLIKNLSKGYRQRVGMSQALVGNPELLIFDEPTVGLDPRQIIEIRKLIKQLGKQHTVVLSSHILSEVSDVCERVIIINQGQIVAQDTLENLSQGISETRRLSVRIAGSPSNAQKLIRAIEGVQYVESLGTKEPDTVDFLVESAKNQDVRRAIFNTMSKVGYPILVMRPMDMTLEDIFLQLTTESEGVV
ncbi:MAG: ABC transporter ATP-binding protein [Christensenellales bacterium]|jgi:ABC-2 type transport system ATP-binding protein